MRLSMDNDFIEGVDEDGMDEVDVQIITTEKGITVKVFCNDELLLRLTELQHEVEVVRS